MSVKTFSTMEAAQKSRPKVGDRIVPAPRRPRHLIEVRGAGGVVWRDVDGQVEVLLIHRPARPGVHGPEWTFPKGRAEIGERPHQTAVREVFEEAGVRAVIDVELASAAFTSLTGRPKIIRFYAMHTNDPGRPDGVETDEVRWVSVAEAREMLTFEHYQPVLDSFEMFAPLITRGR